MEGLIDTRNEYIEHIQDILSVAISKRIYAIYTEMMNDKKGLKGFQNELYSIRKWNNNMVNDEYKKIVKYTKCKYLSNLIKIIIITTIKIKIYEYREQFDNIKIKIPNPEDFVHKCYINAASFSWKNAYLYNKNNIKDAEYQNNLNIIEENIRSIIKKTFRDFVPFDEIFKQIEDNLTNNVNQFKDTDEEDAKITNNAKNNSEKQKKTTTEKVIAIKEVCKEAKDEEDDAEEGEEGDEGEEGEEGDAEEGEENDEDDAEEGEDDAEEDDDEEGEEGDEGDEGEEGEEGDEEDDEDDDEESEEGDEEGDKKEVDEEDDKENDDEDDEENDDDDDDDDDEEEGNEEGNEEGEEKEEKEDAKYANEKKIEFIKESKYNNKINNIVDTSLRKDDYKKEEDNKEISFFKSEKTNTESKGGNYKEKERKNVNNEWNNIKVEYNSLSQNKMDYKKSETENAKNKNKEYDDDTASIASVKSVKSVTSVLSNITDISQVKKIHINEATNKNKKPSFF
jgi:hypothetical protein